MTVCNEYVRDWYQFFKERYETRKLPLSSGLKNSERSVDSESPLFSVMQCTVHLSLNNGNLKSRFGKHSAGVLIQASSIHHES